MRPRLSGLSYLSVALSLLIVCAQGQGIGTKLLLHAISVVRSELKGTMLWCDARQATQPWYERRGLEAFGDVFWKGPVKYIRMKIDIDTV